MLRESACGFDGAELFGGSPKGAVCLRGIEQRAGYGVTWKGFDLTQLERFGVRRDRGGIVVPYFARTGQRYREKLYAADGGTRWLGESKPQIPYGLEDLGTGGDAVILTEGESDALALRLAYPKAIVLGLPGASSWRSEWAVYLDDFRRVYLSFDADRAGEELERSVKQDVPHYRTIELPKGADTRDVIQQLGKRAYRILVEQADRGWEVRQAWAGIDEIARRRLAVDRAWQARQSA